MKLNFARILAPLAGLVAALVLALSFAAPGAIAQELSPEQITTARQYVDLSYKSSIYEQSLLQAGIDVDKLLLQQNPTINKQANDAIGRTIAFFAKRKDDVYNQFARVYASRFTLEELKQLVAFAETPVGKKLADQLTAINNEILQVYQVYESNMRQEFFAKVRADLKEQGIQL